MSNDRSSERANPSGSIEVAARQWHELDKVLEDIKGSPHAGANFLSHHRDQMAYSTDRLLELGLDVSDHRNFRVVPVPAARHPKTKDEARTWEAETLIRIEQHMLSYAVTCAGTHVVHSAVEDEALVEVLVGYTSDADARLRESIAALIARSTLEYVALACSLWLLEPTGAMRASAADLDAACFNRMLYAFEINPLMRAHRQVKNNKLPEAVRSASMDAAAGWSLANLKWNGKPGDVLRRALGEEYERYLQELPSASLIAWADREPLESLRSTGNRDKNLARRVAANLEKIGNEDATRPGKLVHHTFGMANQEVDGQVGAVLGEYMSWISGQITTRRPSLGSST
jgi:hypothetical protein